MKIIAVVAAASAVFAAAPAQAAPIPAPQAVSELTAAIIATNDADTYTFTDLRRGQTAALNRTASQYQQDGLRVFRDQGTFVEIDWPSERVARKVRGPSYLTNVLLQWSQLQAPIDNLEIPMWTDLLEPNSDRLGQIYFPPREADVAYADKTAVPEGQRYIIGNAYYEEIYTVDTAGRIVRLENTRGAGLPLSGEVRTWSYAPVSVAVPAEDTVMPYATVQRAIEAATLNNTIRDLARTSASDSRGQGLRSMRAIAEENVGIYNAGGMDDSVAVFVRIKIRNVSGGVRIFRTNPLTGTFHAWRVTRGSGGWQARKVAP